MRRVMAVMMAVLFCWCFTASAQEQRGVIEGVVRDASGAVLPGVTVEAKAENGAVITTRDRPHRYLPLPVSRARWVHRYRHHERLSAAVAGRRPRRPRPDQEGRLRAAARRA